MNHVSEVLGSNPDIVQYLEKKIKCPDNYPLFKASSPYELIKYRWNQIRRHHEKRKEEKMFQGRREWNIVQG